MSNDTEWYKDAIFYELQVKSFCDGNGDGVGDFAGLLSKLDHLQALGVTCLWVTPFYPSPLRDDGYDIADYMSVHPNYGTIGDVRRLVEEAHRRGLKVLTDFVMNHTSDQHAWFQAARSDRSSPYRDYYVWSDTDQLYQEARIIFTDTEPSNWTWDEQAGQYFWHRFFSHQPDLNFDSPKVREEMLAIARFWLDMGIDGFRADAVPYLFERPGTNGENLPETHAYLKEVRAYIEQHYPGRILLAEANQWPDEVRPYFGDGDEFHMAFNFPVMPRLYMALRREDRSSIVEIMSRLPAIPAGCQWCLFLRNHDELTLEMVTDEERDYMWAEYAPNPRMKLNLGIRRRLAPLLDNDRRRVELLNSIIFTLPGSPIVYYGDEIGMGDNIALDDRNGVRTPMQWSSAPNAGFSEAEPAQLYAPVIDDPVFGYAAVNVERQTADPSSLLAWMQRLIAVRKRYPIFSRGSLTFCEPANLKVLAYLREHEGQTVLVVHNLASSAQSAELDLAAYAGATPTEIFGGAQFPGIGAQSYAITLAPYGSYWLELKR